MISIRHGLILALGAAGLVLSACSPARMHFTEGNALNSSLGASPDDGSGSGNGNGSGVGGGSGAGAGGAASGPIVDADSLQKACAAAASQQMQTFPLHFPKSVDGCEWGANGNIGMSEGRFQARREQEQLVTLPPNAVICGLEFHFANQPFYYDDEFLFTFNGVVMASSYNLGSLFPAVGIGYQEYDWNKMVGHPWTDGTPETYCAGKGQGLSMCSFPATSTTGTIALSYKPELIYAVAARNLATNVHQFHWITTGDNDDPVDCRHEPVDVDVDVHYIIK
jgi:hypothetical protein